MTEDIGSDPKQQSNQNTSDKGCLFYLKAKGLFLIVSIFLIGLKMLLFHAVGWDLSNTPRNANGGDFTVESLAIVIFFTILFGHRIKLPLLVGFVTLAMVPLSFVIIPKFLNGTLQLKLLIGLVIIEIIAIFLTFKILFWIWEEEGIQPPW